MCVSKCPWSLLATDCVAKEISFLFSAQLVERHSGRGEQPLASLKKNLGFCIEVMETVRSVKNSV